jgi:phenazine biosynthesis protein
MCDLPQILRDDNRRRPIMPDNAQFPGSGEEADLRKLNRATVEKYMNTRGQDRLRRHLLFTEDGVGGLWTNDTGQPIAIHGRDRLAEHAIWSLKCFPDWAWINIEVFETQDPNFFWVECDGAGAIRFPGYPEGHYTNHFLHSFRLENGKITQQREFMNPFEQLRALGIPIPEVKREGIPT